MDEKEFKERTKSLALRAIKLTEFLPKTTVGEVVGRQLLRSSTSVGANYRAACRAKSPKDMIHKLRIVEEEADESVYWLELICELELIKRERLEQLMAEFNEIVSMVVASQRTLRSRFYK